MFNSILVVCIGNICRSSIGEHLLRHYLPTQKIASAGVNALVGYPADPNTVIVAEKRGIDLSNHIARQLTAELCNEYDLILVMDPKLIDSVAKISSSAISKTMLFGQWSAQQKVPDPYKKDLEMFELVYRQINEAARLWAAKLIHK